MLPDPKAVILIFIKKEEIFVQKSYRFEYLAANQQTAAAEKVTIDWTSRKGHVPAMLVGHIKG